MASTIASLIAQVRYNLNEPVASFWSDAELLGWMNLGAKDLWRSLNDVYQDYFHTNDTTHVTHAAGATSLTGVPADVATVRGIEPLDLATYGHLRYQSKDYMHPDFQAARGASQVEPGQGGTIYFWVSGAGSPIAAPTIAVAPVLTATIPLRLVYVPAVPNLTADGSNPIPWESDMALVAWTTAFAKGKRTEPQVPDADWLTIYGTEKAHILTAATPRQTQDEEIVEALFEPYW